MSSGTLSEKLNRRRNWLTDFGGDHLGANACDGAWAECVAFAQSKGFNSIVIPAGDFLFESPVVLPDGMRLRGESWEANWIYAGTGAAIKYSRRSLIENLSIKGVEGAIVSGSRGLATTAESPSFYNRIATVRNCLIQFFEDGIYLNFNGVITLDTNYLIGCTNGLRLSGSENNALNVIGGEIRECDIGILDDGTTGYVQTYRTVTIEGNRTYGYRKTGSGNSSCLTFDCCYFEANDSSGDGTDISVNTFINALAIRGSLFVSSTNCVNVLACTRGVIEDSYFAGDVTNLRLGSSCRNVTERRNFYSGTDKFTAAVDSGSMTDRDITPRPYGTTQVIALGTTDCYAGLQSWLDANPKRAHLPQGTYLLSQPLVQPDGQLLTGDGWQNTILRPVAGVTTELFKFGSHSTTRDLQFLGRDTASSVGVKPATNAVNVLLERVHIQDFATGLLIDSGAQRFKMADGRIFSCSGNGVLISAGAHNFVLDHVHIANSGAEGILISGVPLQGTIDKCNIELSGDGGIVVTGNDVQGLSIINNHLGQNGAFDCHLSGQVRGARFVGNRCATTAIGLLIHFADYTVIHGNSFGNPTNSILIDNAAAVGNDIGTNWYDFGAVAFDYALHNSGTKTRYLGRILATSSPNGTGPWDTGDIVWNRTPASLAAPGWVCTVGHATAATFLPLPSLS